MAATTHAKSFSETGPQKFGTQANTPAKVIVFKGGDKHHEGKEFLLKNYKNIAQFQQKAAQELQLLPAIRGFYTTQGTLINDLSEMSNGQKIIAVQTGHTFNKEKINPAAFS